jgi:hypothetical protein
MIRFVVPRSQDFGLLEFLDYWGDLASSPFDVVHYESLAARSSVPRGTWVLAALDQLTPHGLHLVRELESQLRASEARPSVLNSADTTLLRCDLLQRLYAEGLNRHTAVKATAGADATASLRFPVFLREEHQHTGALSPLLFSPRDLGFELAKAVVRGYRLRDLLIVEFVDTKSDDGFYRKYAAFVIGSAVVPQFMSQDTDWMLKLGRTEHTAVMIAEEYAWVRDNPHEPQLRRLFELAGVQYGRIDYAVVDGVVETWEINLNPTLARYPSLSPGLQALRRPTTELFHERFHAAFRATDTESRAATGATTAPIGGAVAIRFSDEILGTGVTIIRGQYEHRFPDWVSSVLRPIRPLIELIIRLLSPLLVRISRR